MKLNPENFQKLPDDVSLDMKNMPTSPLILIKSNGDVSYGGQHKRQVVERYNESEGDIMLFAWSGQWRTDVFLLTEEDLYKHYK